MVPARLSFGNALSSHGVWPMTHQSSWRIHAAGLLCLVASIAIVGCGSSDQKPAAKEAMPARQMETAAAADPKASRADAADLTNRDLDGAEQFSADRLEKRKSTTPTSGSGTSQPGGLPQTWGEKKDDPAPVRVLATLGGAPAAPPPPGLPGTKGPTRGLEVERSHIPFPDEPAPASGGKARNITIRNGSARTPIDAKDRPAPADDESRPQNETRGGTAPSGERSKDNKGKDDKRPAPAKEPPPAPPKPKGPQVWHRDATRPTFARVYVGDRNSLELVSLQVSVIIEGPRARTLVDHVFHNPHDRRLEGTFEYPLPAGASPSYYAMFIGQTGAVPPARFRPQTPSPEKPTVRPEMLAPAQLARAVDTADWGKLQEARIVAPEKALEAYEEVVRGQIDPALLEYASGNTFRGRVFPILPKGYNRVILAYEETLPVTDNRLLYRYSLPGCKVHELRFNLQADANECKDPTITPKEARKESTSQHIVYSHTWSDATPTGDVVFSATPTNLGVQTTSGKKEEKGPIYLYSRIRPELPKVEKEKSFAEHGVFLLDTSLSEDPDRFAVSMKLLKAILENDANIKQFNILAFNAGAAWVEPKGWIANTKEGRDKALARLDGVLLEGATDLSSALDKLVSPGFPLEKATPINCFVLSDGHLTWGQSEVAPLVARFRQQCPNPVRFYCYRTGLGQENAELFDALTRDGGGIFQCFGEAEVAAAASAHGRQCLTVKKVTFEGQHAEEVLVSGRRSAVYPGGELIVVGQFDKPGKAKVLVEGDFQGKEFKQAFDVDITTAGELAPRGWGEVAVASLLSLNDPWTERLITAYCQEFNIASRTASFLVLENEADYKRFNLDEEKGNMFKGELAYYLADVWKQLGKKRSDKDDFSRLLFKLDARMKILAGPGGEALKGLMALLEESDCGLPQGTLSGVILSEKEANADYLKARKEDRRNVHAYLTECQRRANDNDVDGAVRVLSSVIEEHSGRGDALRLVGYRLLDLQRPELAAGLFSQVLRQRPFEPHSFRDLARSLEESGRYPLAALLHEVVLTGTWHNRFHESIKTVTREDQVRLLRAGLKSGKLTGGQKTYFEKRLQELAGSEPSADLRVSITWNTDATDVDLWVIEPDGTKVFYQQPKSKNGGELSQDQTQGYGPERYFIRTAKKGTYKILVHYYRANANLLGGETHVNAVITRRSGTNEETVEKRTVILRNPNEQQEVLTVRY
jgi:von Willebrand factor type A domain